MSNSLSPFVAASRASRAVHKGKEVLRRTPSPNPERGGSGEGEHLSKADSNYERYLAGVEAAIEADKVRCEEAKEDLEEAKESIERETALQRVAQEDFDRSKGHLEEARLLLRTERNALRTARDALFDFQIARQRGRAQNETGLEAEVTRRQGNIIQRQNDVAQAQREKQIYENRISYYQHPEYTIPFNHILQQEVDATVTIAVLTRQAKEVDPFVKSRSYYNYLVKNKHCKDPYSKFVKERADYQDEEMGREREEFRKKKRTLDQSDEDEGAPALSTATHRSSVVAGPPGSGKADAPKWTWEEKEFRRGEKKSALANMLEKERDDKKGEENLGTQGNSAIVGLLKKEQSRK